MFTQCGKHSKYSRKHFMTHIWTLYIIQTTGASQKFTYIDLFRTTLKSPSWGYNSLKGRFAVIYLLQF